MNDIDIAHSIEMLNIKDIIKDIGIEDKKTFLYGRYKAKIKAFDNLSQNGKLILVTATNPTPFGEGKTTVSIGLADAFHKLGKKAILALREPSLGPVFGMKGGATGGGYSQIVPMEDINLHFTGDFAAIEVCNNLICAAVDNHIYQGNKLGIKKILVKRCIDVNDRSLRNISCNGVKTSFDITAASEIMAIFCLASSFEDLRERLSRMIVGEDNDGNNIYVYQLGIVGSLLALLKDAFNPNLVQTLEHTPAFVHGGPFANIAHGCSSVIATKMALNYGEYAITEAGFGADLGALKFFDIKCRSAKLTPYAVVLVTTIRSLKYNDSEGNNNLLNGLDVLRVHILNMKKFSSNLVVCINKFNDDSLDDIKIVSDFCSSLGVSSFVSTAYSDGGDGLIDLAKYLTTLDNNNFKLLYDDSLSLKEKIEIVCKDIYHADSVNYTDDALVKISKLNNSKLPICVAKTQYSLSDDAKKVGITSGFSVTVSDIRLYNGAGFITVYLGKILTMPGLPKKPNYLNIDVVNDKIVGLK